MGILISIHRSTEEHAAACVWSGSDKWASALVRQLGEVSAFAPWFYEPSDEAFCSSATGVRSASARAASGNEYARAGSDPPLASKPSSTISLSRKRTERLSARKVRVCLQGHHSYWASVNGVHETLKALRSGARPSELKAIAPQDLQRRVLRQADYASWQKQFLREE